MRGQWVPFIGPFWASFLSTKKAFYRKRKNKQED
jgi:hypothetical protein